MRSPVIGGSTTLSDLCSKARESSRGRMNCNLHGMDDPIHRLLNATEPRTYVQPHCHRSPPRDETLAVIAGRGAVVCFDDSGEITHSVVLGPLAAAHVIELPAGCWHTLVALDRGTVWFEVKAGPYVSPAPEDRASWAPIEGDPNASDWLARLRRHVARQA
jgi:cupin fold WbuC family metalloprotein